MNCKWKMVTVQDLIDAQMIEEPKDGNHGNIHPKSTDYVTQGIPFIMANDLVNGRVDYQHCAYISEKQAKTLKKGFSRPGDVLLTHKATIGRTAIVTDDYETIILTPQVTYYRTKKGILNRYLKYYFDCAYFQNILANWAGAGSTRAYLGISAQKKLPILLPPLEIQKKIAKVLSALDDKIELNNQINKNLEEQAQALYNSWFVDFEPFGRRRPTSWYMGILSDLANISTGKRPTIKSDIKTSEFCIPIVGASSVMGYTSKSNYNDRILVTGRVGTHGVIQRFSTACWASDNTLVITSNYYEYVNQILGKIDYSSLNRGSTQPLITQGDMNKEPVLIPDTETLNRFETIVGALMTSYDYNNNENMRLEEVRDSLLPKLMSGEIDVDNVEI